MAFQAVSYNRLLYIGLNPALAKAHRVRVAMLPVLLCRPAGPGRHVLGLGRGRAPGHGHADRAGGAAAETSPARPGAMFWWAMLVSITSAVAGLLISAQDWARTATGATIILVACGWFLLSMVVAALRREQAV